MFPIISGQHGEKWSAENHSWAVFILLAPSMMVDYKPWFCSHNTLRHSFCCSLAFMIQVVHSLLNDIGLATVQSYNGFGKNWWITRTHTYKLQPSNILTFTGSWFGHLASIMHLRWSQYPANIWSPFANFPASFWQWAGDHKSWSCDVLLNDNQSCGNCCH